MKTTQTKNSSLPRKVYRVRGFTTGGAPRYFGPFYEDPDQAKDHARGLFKRPQWRRKGATAWVRDFYPRDGELARFRSPRIVPAPGRSQSK